MTPRYYTKLFRSIVDCGCTLSLGDFSEEANLEDVKRWLDERGYKVTPIEDPDLVGAEGFPERL